MAFDRPGHFGGDLVEEVGCVAGGGVSIGLGDGPFGMDVVSIEVLDGQVGADRHAEGVDLDDVARLLERDVAGLSDGVRPLPGLCFAGCLADEVGDTRHPPPGDEAVDDAADRGVGDGEALVAQDWSELLLAPHGKVEPEPLDLGAQRRAPVLLAHPMRPPALRHGRLLPAIKRGARHPHRLRRLLGRQPGSPGAAPSRHRVASSLRFDIWGLRVEKPRRAPAVACNMTGQAKNLHGVLLDSSVNNPSFGELLLSINPSHICLSQVRCSTARLQFSARPG